MPQITITLTDTEYKAMEVIAYSPQEWVENVTKVRAEKAIKKITDEIVQQKLDAGESITSTREQLFLDADLQTAKERTDAEDSTVTP
jgi:hypothetical protein